LAAPPPLAVFDELLNRSESVILYGEVAVEAMAVESCPSEIIAFEGSLGEGDEKSVESNDCVILLCWKGELVPPPPPPSRAILPVEEDNSGEGPFEVTASATSDRTGAAARSIASLPAVW
jgi:hypothetical protein